MSLVDPQTDMAFGQATIFPYHIARKYGVVACCGTFFIRSSPRTKQFFTDVVIRCEECGNDQNATNETLFADDPDVTPPKHKRKYRKIRKDKKIGSIEFSWDDKPLLIIGQDGNTIAKVWSMNTVARLPQLPSNDTVVWHPTQRGGKSGSFRALFGLSTDKQI